MTSPAPVLFALCLPVALSAQSMAWAPDRDIPLRVADVFWDVRADRLVAVSDIGGDAWTFDGQRWRLVQPSGLEAAAPGAVLFTGYDPATAGGIVVIGEGANAFQTSTWARDGAGWSRRVPNQSPHARWTQPAIDPVSGELFVFGGAGIGFQSLDTMHRWSGSSWTEVMPAFRPGPRWDAGMVLDRARNRVVLFGGTAGLVRYDDTWEWDGVQWTQATPVTVPSSRNTRLAFDPMSQRVVMLGGAVGLAARFDDCFEWDGSDWLPQPPLPVLDRAFGCDDGSSVLLVTGEANVWRRGPGGTWTALFSDPTPEGQPWSNFSAGPMFAYHAPRGEAVLAATYPSGDTWRWSDPSGVWQRLSVPGPAPRGGGVLAPLGNDLVLFGGYDSSNLPYGAFDDTWRWDGQSWTQLQPAVAPPARLRHGMVSTGADLLVFGGYPGLDDTWRFDGMNWTQLAPQTVPAGRHDHAMAWDPVRQRALMFGGRVNLQSTNETWEWDGNDWLQRNPANRPIAGECHATFDPAVGQVALVKAEGVWHWDGTDWSLGSAELALSPHAALIHAPQRGQLVLRTLFDTNVLTSAAATADLVSRTCGQAPDLRLFGRSTLGGAADVHLEGRPASPAFVTYGLQPTQLNLAPGCEQLILPITSQFVLTDARGLADVPLPVPFAPALRGLRLLTQAAVIDGGPVFGLSLTGRLTITIGD